MKGFSIFLCLIFLFSCGKEKEASPLPVAPPATAPHQYLVTGFNFFDIYGSPTGKTGSPNVRTGTHINGKNCLLRISPNPVATQMEVMVRSEIVHTKKTIWVVAAPQSEDLTSYNYPKANTSLIDGPPVFQKESTLGFKDEFFLVDLTQFPEGAYRIYAKTDTVLLWENILKNK